MFSGVLLLSLLGQYASVAAFQTSSFPLSFTTNQEAVRLWMTATENDSSSERSVDGHGTLGTQPVASFSATDINLQKHGVAPPGANAFSQAAYKEHYIQERKKVQRQFLEDDPLAAQEAGNGVTDLTPWKVVDQKLTLFSRGSETRSSNFYLPSSSKSKLASKVVPNTAREVSNTEELKVYPRNRYGEVLNLEKRLVRAQSVNAVLSNSAREVLSTEELKDRPRKSQGREVADEKRYVRPQRNIAREVPSTEELKVLPRNRDGEIVKEEKRYVRAQTIHTGSQNVAREAKSTEELKVYARNMYGEPILEKPCLVIAQSNTATTAAAFLGCAATMGVAREVSSTDELKVLPRNRKGELLQEEKRLVIARKDERRKEQSKQLLATTPTAGMAVILDMDRSKAYTLSSSSKLAASILNNSGDFDGKGSASASPRKSDKESQSHFAMSPSNAFPELLAKSKPVMARSQTTTVYDIRKEKASLFFRPDQTASPCAAKKSSVTVDTPFQYKQVLSQPEQNPANSSPSSQVFAQSLPDSAPLLRRGLAPGLVSGPNPRGQKIFAQIDPEPAVREKRGLDPGLVSRYAPPGQKVFARSFVEPTDKEKRGLSSGVVSVDKPFHYKQIISNPEYNPGQVQSTERSKSKVFVNPGLHTVSASRTSPKVSPPSGITLNEAFQYKQVQSVPPPHENPAGVKAPGVAVKSMIPTDITDIGYTAASSMSAGDVAGPSPPMEKDVATLSDSPESSLTEENLTIPTVQYTVTGLSREDFAFPPVPEVNLVTPLDGSMAKVLAGPSPEEVYTQVDSGVLSVLPRKKERASDASQATFTETTEPVEELTYDPNVVSPGSVSMANAISGPQPEDVYVQINSGVLPVPIRKKNRKNIPKKQPPPSEETIATVPYVGNTMAKAISGPSPEDVYVQIDSGVLSVPMRKKTKKNVPQKQLPPPEQSIPTVPYVGNSMAKAISGPSPEDVYVQIDSGVLSVPIRKKKTENSPSTVPKDVQAPQQKLVTPNDSTMTNAYSGISPEVAYLQIASRVSVPPKRSKSVMNDGPNSKSLPKMAGPADRPLPNPSGIITFPYTKPRTTVPPGIAAPSTLGQHRRPQYPLEGSPMNLNDITHKNLVGRPKKKLVAPSSGSMAKGVDGPYSALPGEEPLPVVSNILPVPIRNMREATSKLSSQATHSEEHVESNEENESSIPPDCVDL